MPTNRLLAVVLPSLLLPLALGAGSGCGDNERPARSLVITSPTAGTELCGNRDESLPLPGLQQTVVVQAVGFRRGDEITLSVIGGGGESASATVQSNMGDSSEVAFSMFNLPEGTVVLQATAGDVQSPPVSVVVNTTAPDLTFLAPRPGTQAETIGELDDLDPATDPIDYEVVVQTDIEDGGDVNLTAQPPQGAAVDLGPAAVAGGMATWQVPFNQPGLWTLTVEGANGCGNMGMQTVEIFVDFVPTEVCILSFDPAPLDVGTRSVLNASIDDPAQPGFQSTITVDANEPDATIRLYLNNTETATAVTDATGVAVFEVDLPENTNLQVRASCTDRVGNVADSLTQSLLVDITPPTCTIDTPADGAILAGTTPPLAFTIGVTIGGGDVDGELAEISVDGADLPPETISSGMASFDAQVSAADPSVPILLTAQDHAANGCSDTNTVSVDLEGCNIEITSPTATVFADADNDPGNGVQIDVVVSTSSTECFSRTVQLTNCSASNSPIDGTFSATGSATIRTTFCASGQCEQTRTCTATVTEPGSNIVTSDSATISVDNLPPNVTMSIVSPSVACGATITAANDFDPTTAGAQVQVRQISAVSDKRFLVTPEGGAPVEYVADGSGFAVITITAGQSSIVATATDPSGTGTSAPCSLSLATLGISITDPLNGETLGAADGTVSGSDLVIQVCGTVTDGSATVTVSVDGGPAVTAAVTGTTWCASGVTVPSGGPHAITASGSTAGGESGSHTVNVFVDVLPPGPATGLLLSQLNRRTVQVDFTEPADAGGGPVDLCVVKSSTTPISSPAIFEALGGGRTVTGTGPGTSRSVTVSPLRIGPANARFWAVRCYDDAGNGSTLVSAGPFELNFELGPILSPTSTSADNDFGASMAGADLNADGIDDLIVGAPSTNVDNDAGDTTEGRVYVYLGTGSGLSPGAPDFIIDAAAAGFARLGQGVTRIDWNDDGIDDIAVGAPFSGTSFAGEVYVFLGGASMWTPGAATTTYTTANAQVTLGLGAEDAGFTPALSLFGWSLAAVDFDGDGRQDLVSGTPFSAGSSGGALVVFGGSSASSIVVPDTLDEAGTKAIFFTFSGAASTPQFGTQVAALGAISGIGDTAEDFAVSSAADAAPGIVGERVALFYGRGQPGPKLQIVDGSTAEEQITPDPESDGLSGFGERLGAMEDLNGDGRRELLISAPRYGGDQGRVYVISVGGFTGGSPLVTQASSAAFLIFEGGASQRVGAALANPAVAKVAADIDGDGLDDFAIAYGGGLLLYFGEAGMVGILHEADADDLVSIPAGWSTISHMIWAGDLDNDNLEDLVWADANPMGAGTGFIEPLY